MTILEIKQNDIIKESDAQPVSLPKYVSGVLNDVNIFSKGTRPEHVGQVSDEIQLFDQEKSKEERTLDEWKKWHKEKHPDGLDKAKAAIKAKLKDYQDAVNNITDQNITDWLEDLVYTKTFYGLEIQNAIIRILAKKYNKVPTFSTPEMERQGIDGKIGDVPVQIKSVEYKRLNSAETTSVNTIYYKKENKKVILEYDEQWFL